MYYNHIREVINNIGFPFEEFLLELKKNELLLLIIAIEDEDFFNENRKLFDISTFSSKAKHSEVLADDVFNMSKDEQRETLLMLLKGSEIESKIIENIIDENKENLNIVIAIRKYIDEIYLTKLHNYMKKYRESEDLKHFLETEYFLKKKPCSNMLASLVLLNDEQTNKYVEKEELYFFTLENTLSFYNIATMQQNKRLLKEIEDLNVELKKQKRHIQNQIAEKDEEIKRLTREIKSLTESQSNLYEAMIQNLNDKILELRETNRKKTDEIRNLKKEVQILESMSIIELLDVHIHENGGVLDEGLTKYLSKYSSELASIQRDNKDTREKKGTFRKSSPVRIGFVEINKNKHYAHIPKREPIPIENIPEATYIGDKEFAAVDITSGKYLKLFNHQFEESSVDFLIDKFVTIIKKNDGYFYNDGRNTHRIMNIPPNIRLHEGQVVSLDSNGAFLRYYKPINFNADIYMKSIKAKDHTPYYVVNMFKDGALLRNIETSEEYFCPSELFGNYNIDEQQLIFFDKNMSLITVVANSHFYTLSSLYNEYTTYGTIESKESNIFIKKITGELVLLNKIPYNIQLKDGDVVIIDEKNNFLGLKQDRIDSLDLEKTSSINNKKKNNKEDKILPPTDKTIAILGNESYKNAYTVSLLKKGYEAKVINGFESWPKIMQQVKDVDMIVVITNHISHDNMYKIKEEISDTPVIYSKYDGANRIAEDIDSYWAEEAIS